MDEKAYIRLLKNMLGIYSPSGKEEKLAEFLKKEFESLGFAKTWTDKAGNVYSEVGSGSPTVLLCGHMDTVPGWIPVKIEDNQLCGRGAVDAKASLAAMVATASSLEPDLTKNGKIIIAGVVEEERKAKGICQLVREGLKIDYAVFGEPSGVQNITFAYKGKLGLRLTCETVSGHVGAQHLLDNAIEKSFDLWNRLKASYERYRSPRGVFYSVTPCLINISGCRTSGGVPDQCVMDIDLRLPPTVNSEKGRTITQEVVEGFRTDNQAVSVSLRVTDSVEPFIAKRMTPLMKALDNAIVEVTGGPVRFLRKTGTSDMNIFGGESNVPVATYGPGDARLSHTQYEYIDVSEYLTSIRIYKRAVERIML